jgi:hypothetical protein
MHCSKLSGFRAFERQESRTSFERLFRGFAGGLLPPPGQSLNPERLLGADSDLWPNGGNGRRAGLFLHD